MWILVGAFLASLLVVQCSKKKKEGSLSKNTSSRTIQLSQPIHLCSSISSAKTKPPPEPVTSPEEVLAVQPTQQSKKTKKENVEKTQESERKELSKETTPQPTQKQTVSQNKAVPTDKKMSKDPSSDDTLKHVESIRDVVKREGAM